jgi:hypothetical protein
LHFQELLHYFFNKDRYGQSMEIMRDASQVWATLKRAVDANLCVPQERGELILQRQVYMLQALNVTVEDILEMGSTTRSQNKPSKKSAKAATAAFSNSASRSQSKSFHFRTSSRLLQSRRRRSKST